MPGQPSLDVTAGDGEVSYQINDGNLNGTTVTKRKIYYTTGSTTKIYDAGTNSSGVISGLTNESEYSFSATVLNSNGEGKKSQPVTVTPHVEQ